MLKINNQKVFMVLYTLFCLAIIMVMIVSLARQQRDNKLYEDKTAPLSSELAFKWLKAVEKNEAKKAIAIANKVLITQFPYVPNASYLDLTDSVGININFYEAPFGMIDFMHWRDMLYLNGFLKVISPKAKPTPENIYKFIDKDIAHISYKSNNERPAFYSKIIIDRKGDLIDKYLLYTMLCIQAGYPTHLILVFKENTSLPVCIFAESLVDQNFVTADIKAKVFKKKSANAILSQLKEEYKCIVKTELPALFYKKKSQRLNNFLVDSAGAKIPFIGIDPILYQSKLKRNISNFHYILGAEPLVMLRNSKYFLKEWLTQKSK